MRCLLLLLIGLASSATAQLDNNSAFFEGERFDYVLHPPVGFVLNTRDARADGYSFAFIPEDQTYDTARVIIAGHFYRIRGLVFDSVLTADTARLREHFGSSTTLTPLDDATIGNDRPITGFFVNNRDYFLPTLFTSYFNGESEIVILDCLIAEAYPRSAAEDVYFAALAGFRVTERRDISHHLENR